MNPAFLPLTKAQSLPHTILSQVIQTQKPLGVAMTRRLPPPSVYLMRIPNCAIFYWNRPLSITKAQSPGLSALSRIHRARGGVKFRIKGVSRQGITTRIQESRSSTTLLLNLVKYARPIHHTYTHTHAHARPSYINS